MRRNIFISVFSCLMLAAGTVAAQDSEGVISNYYKVTGLDKFADSLYGNYYFERLDTQGEEVVESKVHVSYPGKYRIEANQMNDKVVMVLNGDKGWVRTPGEKVRELRLDGVNVMRSVYDLFDMLMFHDSCLSFANDGETKSDGKTFRKVIVTDTTPNTTTPSTEFYFDSSTGFLDHAVSQVKFEKREIKTIMFFRNYEKLAGFMLPTEVATMMDDREEMVIRTITVVQETPAVDIFDELK